MNDIYEFMARMNNHLANDYKTRDGRHSESCMAIAAEAATKLFQKGKRPAICFVERLSEDRINSTHLAPKRYEGRVSGWAAHVFPVWNKQVFDPMVSSKPVAIEDYSALAFERCSEIKIYIPPQRISEFVARWGFSALR